jgi:hypothetical protein
MACHIMDMAYWALELGYPASVDALHDGGSMESPPHWSIITYEFPARGARPPVRMLWYDGNKVPGADIMAGKDPKQFSTVLVGDKGIMYYQRGRMGWEVKPSEILKDFTVPPETLPRVRNEDREWIDACLGGPPALSNFTFSGPFTETVLAGNLAIRAGKKLHWDGPAMKATNAPEVERFVRREYRDGWSL